MRSASHVRAGWPLVGRLQSEFKYTLNERLIRTMPVVTLILYAYNEERFIREAIESVFAQTYSPLEIVLSDDGSADHTFEIMREMADAYQGPHKIILNRNERNIGIGSQLNAAIEKTSGELILLANGDDRSRPYRVSRTVDAWLATGKTATVISSPLQTIDGRGHSIESQVLLNNRVYVSLEDGLRNRFSGVGLAASVALRRDVFTSFSAINPALILEDNPLYLRARLLGPARLLEEPLVDYRIHADNISQAYDWVERSEWARRFYRRALWQRSEGVKAYCQMLNDIAGPNASAWPADDLERGRFVAMGKLLENELYRQFYAPETAVPISDRWKFIADLAFVQLKLTLKSWIPWLKDRDVKWHYRRVTRPGEPGATNG